MGTAYKSSVYDCSFHSLAIQQLNNLKGQRNLDVVDVLLLLVIIVSFEHTIVRLQLLVFIIEAS